MIDPGLPETSQATRWVRRDRSALPWFLVIGGIALVLVGGGAVGLSGRGPLGPDAPWRDLLAAHRTPGATAIAEFLSIVGGTLWTTIITGAIVATLLLRRHWSAAAVIGVTVPLATGLETLLKVVVHRPRPGSEVLSQGGYSYPSGHVTAAAALTGALAILLWRIWVTVLATAWIAGMAWVRTYLSVHWLSDTVAAAVLGLSIALLVALTVRYVARRVRTQAAEM